MPRPNILVLTTHDTGRHLGCYGVETVHTEHIDAFAAQGCRFTNYFASSALCSPSRAAMMTGRYPQSNGMMGLCHAPWWWALNEGERHLSTLLRDAGYETALIGHQHETTDTSSLGWDRVIAYRVPDENMRHTYSREVADAVEAFLAEQREAQRPFFAQVGFFETHRPFDFGGDEPDDSRGVYVPPYLQENDELRADLALFQGNIRRADRDFGRILEALKTHGLEENTLVVFTTDHGIHFPRAKATLYDAGTGICLIMRLPHVIEAGCECDWLLQNIDFVPTILELIGVPVPDSIQGRSFAGAFRGGDRSPRDAVFTEQTRHGGAHEIRAVRTDGYKLIRNFVEQRVCEPPVPYPKGPGHMVQPFVELYDLKRDPEEFKNLADHPVCAGMRREMTQRLYEWLVDVDDPILDGPVASPYYLRAREDLIRDI